MPDPFKPSDGIGLEGHLIRQSGAAELQLRVELVAEFFGERLVLPKELGATLAFPVDDDVPAFALALL
jgi:hypothetical protein